MNGVAPSISLWRYIDSELFPCGLFQLRTVADNLRISSSSTPRDPDPDTVVVGLGRLLGKSINSAVYQVLVPGAEEVYAVKYYAFCETSEDSIARETTVLNKLNELEPDVAPEHFYSSEAGRLLPTAGKGKLSYELPKCSSDEGTYIRYMVMERVSSTLYHMLSYHGRIPIPLAAAMTLQVIRLIKAIHQLDVVHGDIHLCNVAIRKKRTKQLVLIDFGLARYGELLDPSAYATPNIDRPLWCHGFISAWESLGWQSSFRDDIYRAIQMMAILVHGQQYYEQMEAICNQWAKQGHKQHYLELKSESNFFDTEFRVPTEGGVETHDFRLHSVIEPESSETIPWIRQRLDDLLSLTRAPRTPMEKPDYSGIESTLVDLIISTNGEPPTNKDPAYIEFIR